jgi:cell wall-associated NlpC family hydrolase
VKGRVTTVGTHPGTKVSLLRRGAAILAMATAVLAAADMAGAQPQPTISQVKQKIAALTSRQDQLVQRLDQVTQELAAARRQLAAVSRREARYRLQFRTMRSEIAQMAAYAYEYGTMTSPVALLTPGGPQRVASQAAMLTHLSTSQHQRMEVYVAAARKLTTTQQTLRRTEAGVVTLKGQITAQKAALAKLISKQKSTLATLTARQRAAARAASVGSGGTTASTFTGPTATQAQRAVAFAYAQLGKPYVWGATGPDSFDCSGLVMTAWASVGVSIPRVTYQQWATLPHVPMSDIQPGDLVFFDAVGHVAIYVGNNMIIDAPQPGESVEKISLSSPWYAANLDGAARP